MKRVNAIRIEPAMAADEAAIAALLREAKLPHEDFASHLRHFLVARSNQAVVAAIGAEVCGGEALLRSLVVAPPQRRTGLGSRLVEELNRVGEGWGVQRWWLLTTTAERFFIARGFRVRDRAEAPATITATEEFRGLCPSMAVCFSRERKVLA